MICKKCGKDFQEDWRKSRETPCDFCCRSCSNSREQTEEIKLKKSKKLKGKKFFKRPITEEAKEKLRINRALKKVTFTCSVCGNELSVNPGEHKKRKYCSGKCRNIATNIFKNGSVSKAEIILRDILTEAGFLIENNRRDILDGLEIDIWIPSLNIGIEYNGIYHLKPIKGEQALSKIKEKDLLKIERAKELGVTLLIVEDYKSTPKEVSRLGKELLLKINSICA